MAGLFTSAVLIPKATDPNLRSDHLRLNRLQWTEADSYPVQEEEGGVSMTTKSTVSVQDTYLVLRAQSGKRARLNFELFSPKVYMY